MEEALEHLDYAADQTYVLRMAIADITAIAGPPSEEMGRRKRVKDPKIVME